MKYQKNKPRRKIKVKTEILGEVLRTFVGGDVLSGSKGFEISCPFHQDNDPSCTVFYDTGVFSCYSCGAKQPLVVGLRKLGVPQSQIERFIVDPEQEEKVPLKPLEDEAPSEVKEDETVGVVSEEPWPVGWGYRAIRPEMLTSETSPIRRLFAPSLVRLSITSKGKTHQERFSRIGLKTGRHHVYLRLSTEQEVRVYNSGGLSQKDARQPLFGLTDFHLPKSQAGIILVEGPYDLLRTVQNLVDLKLADHFTVLALLGVSQWDSFLTKFELRMLPQLGDTPIILAFDNDAAGKTLTLRAQRDCEKKLLLPPSRILTLKYEAPDPGDTDRQGLKRSLIHLGY